MDRQKIGEKLINLRGNKTQEHVARDLKVSLSSIKMYELGLRSPRDDVKVEIAKYYNTTVEDIFFTP